jgi:hypothetical protein
VRGAGAWCQGPGDTAGGQTLRLAGNHKSDAANPYSSDLNGDGISELLFANSTTAAPMSSTAGGFTGGRGRRPARAGARASAPTCPPSAQWSAVADLNGDGRPEVIFSNYSGSTFNVNSYIYWGQAGGPYGVQYSPARAPTCPPVGATVGRAVADLNGDGRPEVIFANWRSDNLNVTATSTGDRPAGHMACNTARRAHRSAHQWVRHSMAVADLNGDGRPEVIFANYHRQQPSREQLHLLGTGRWAVWVQYSPAHAPTCLPWRGWCLLPLT